MNQRCVILPVLAAVLSFPGSPLVAADAPSIATVMAFRPVQKDIEVETPKESEYSSCKIDVERSDSMSGWVVTGANGQVLRRFVDTDSDGIVDQWRYFNLGLEVYRDIDGDNNKKVDQSRWLNTAGSRWGLDRNEDGTIDEWKILSAEEASREAIEAMIAGDPRRLSAVLITPADMDALKMAANVAKQLTDNTANPAAKIREVLSQSKVLNSRSNWARFDNSTLMPSIVPAEPGKSGQDLFVYQSAMAMVDNAGQTALVQLGEMVRVGDVWKLTQIPQPIEGDSLTTMGVLMQPTLASASATPNPGMNYSPEVRRLLEELQKLDENSPSASASRAQMSDYNRRRADLLERLVSAAATESEREEWTRQMVAGVAAAVQTGGYPEGLERLRELDSRYQRSAPRTPLAAFIRYRLVLAQYTLQIQAGKSAEDREKVQGWWLEQLEAFVKAYPESDDSADALLQLAITQEFSTKLADAEKWYSRLVQNHPGTSAAERAEGALRRFGLKDQTLALQGPGLDGRQISLERYRGRVVLVYFWATWCQPCTEDLPQIRALYEQYRSQGFEIIGINLDSTKDPIAGYLSQYRVTWPQIFEPGGLECRLAKQFGIISLPTVFLVDSKGTVVNRNASVEDLKIQLPELFKK